MTYLIWVIPIKRNNNSIFFHPFVLRNIFFFFGLLSEVNCSFLMGTRISIESLYKSAHKIHPGLKSQPKIYRLENTIFFAVPYKKFQQNDWPEALQKRLKIIPTAFRQHIFRILLPTLRKKKVELTHWWAYTPI